MGNGETLIFPLNPLPLAYACDFNVFKSILGDSPLPLDPSLATGDKMNPPVKTDSVRVPCKYCGTTILPDTFKRTGGFCMPCANNPNLTHGLFYLSSVTHRETRSAEATGTTQRPCRFCKTMILHDTARRTGGFCMPHSGHARGFLDTLGGVADFGEPVSQKVVFEELFSKETKAALGILFSIMQPEDELRLFSIKPQGEAELIAERGVAMFRKGKCVTGFVAKWMKNPRFDEDHEEVCNREEIAKAFGGGWKKFEREVPEGATFVRFRTSPRSWSGLCGRAGYAVKYKGRYLWSTLTMIS
jgi:hypothetical protein